MPMSVKQLSRLAEAEDQGSTAAGAIGVNAMLLDFYRQSEKQADVIEKAQVKTSLRGASVSIEGYEPKSLSQ